VYKYSLLFNTVRTTTLILGLTRYGGPGRPHLLPSPWSPAWKFEMPRTAGLLFPSTARSPAHLPGPPPRLVYRLPIPRSGNTLSARVARGPDLRARE